jgi:hypothetical protein
MPVLNKIKTNIADAIHGISARRLIFGILVYLILNIVYFIGVGRIVSGPISEIINEQNPGTEGPQLFPLFIVSSFVITFLFVPVASAITARVISILFTGVRALQFSFAEHLLSNGCLPTTLYLVVALGAVFSSIGVIGLEHLPETLWLALQGPVLLFLWFALNSAIVGIVFWGSGKLIHKYFRLPKKLY